MTYGCIYSFKLIYIYVIITFIINVNKVNYAVRFRKYQCRFS